MITSDECSMNRVKTKDVKEYHALVVNIVEFKYGSVNALITSC